MKLSHPPSCFTNYIRVERASNNYCKEIDNKINCPNTYEMVSGTVLIKMPSPTHITCKREKHRCDYCEGKPANCTTIPQRSRTFVEVERNGNQLTFRAVYKKELGNRCVCLQK